MIFLGCGPDPNGFLANTVTRTLVVGGHVNEGICRTCLQKWLSQDEAGMVASPPQLLPGNTESE